LENKYGQDDVFIGVPAVVNRNGIREVVEITLSKDEQEKFSHSSTVLKNLLGTIFPK
jgi:L-lactate dehydrogenase